VSWVPNASPYVPTFGRYRQSAFGPAFAVATALVVALFLLLPVEWIEDHWLRKRLPGPEATSEETIDLPREIRIVEVAPELASPPTSRTLPQAQVEVFTPPESAAPPPMQSPAEEPVAEQPAAGVDGARGDWSFDPTTPYAAGREILLRHPVPDDPIDLPLLLRAVEAQRSADWLLHAAPLDTFAVATVRGTFREQDVATKQRLAPEWMEEMRQRRMQEYWEKYILSDGKN
jgi:hypothetical protein